MKDRFGLGWRPQLALGILSHLDQIDLVEVIADDLFDAPRATRRAIRTLSAQLPVTLHGISLGLASSVPVETKRLEKTARLVNDLHPASWSEHLAFVRGGGLEIGHLAAPPRTAATIEGAIDNLRRARAIVGTAPQVENIATLIDPPGSALDEASWIIEILNAADVGLLLDLHNLYANCLNFGVDPFAFLARLPAERIASVHLAGGRWVRAGESMRLLDDHLHDVPTPVYDLLAEVGARASHSLTVIIERDGHYPPIESLLVELARAREALERGRASRGNIARGEAAA